MVKDNLSPPPGGGITWLLTLVIAAIATSGGAGRAWAQSAATTTTLAVTSGGGAVTSVASGSVVKLTAAVLAGTTPVTVGQVKFCDATAAHCTDIHLLGAAQLTTAGTAELKFTPRAGNHSYKAVFLGTGNDSGSSSSTAALTVTGKYATTTTLGREGKGGSYTLTATVAGAVYQVGLASPTGTVSFVDQSDANAVLGTATLGSGVSSLTWANSQTLANGGLPASVVVADFNGDGIPDMAVANSAGDTLTILLGNGDGTFTASAIPTTGSGPISIAVGDFNGDGKVDLAVGCQGSFALTILLGNGDGTFQATSVSPTLAAVPIAIASGDFNGDGKADLAVASGYSGTVTIFLGNGDGTFQAVSTSSSVGTDPLSIVAADFNGDGKTDVAVVSSNEVSGNYFNTVHILLGNGDGTFTAAANQNAGYFGSSIAVGDFNDDGKPDLAVADSGGVEILLGNGDGTFTASSISVGGADFGSIAVGDFNGDGVPDLALGSYSVSGNTVAVLLGNDDGTFKAVSPISVAPEPQAPAIALGDFNGDGRPDVVATSSFTLNGSQEDSVSVFLTQLQETATATASGISPSQAGPDTVVASYPGDSSFAASVSAPTQLYKVQPPPQATTTTLSVTANGSAVTTVESGTVVTLTAAVKASGLALNTGLVNFCDATAAHCTDIHLLGSAQLTSSGTGELKLVPGTGSHSYKAIFAGTYDYGTSASSAASLSVTSPAKFPTTTSIAQSGSVGNYTLTATVSGSGGAAAPTGTVSFLDTSNGNHSLGSDSLVAGTSVRGWVGFQTPVVPGNSPITLATGDFNGDGIPDLAVGGANWTTVAILLGNGDGTFRSEPNSIREGNYSNFVATGDFNGDGIPDLAIATSGNYSDLPGSVSIWLGNGDGTFTLKSSPATGVLPQSVAIADFNGDGIPDLAVANYSDNTLTILLGNGDGTFTTVAKSPATGLSPYFVAAGDFNGDGIQDLAVANSGGSTLTILLGNGDGTFTAAASPTTGNGPAAIAVGDFNGDGKADLAVANYNSGTVTVLLGNGDGTFTTSASPATGGAPTYVAIGDFNGAGIPDLAATNINTSTVAILQGRGDGTFTLAASPATGAGPDAVVAADFNGDGISGLATANFTSNTVTVLLPNELASTATLTGVSPAGSGTHLIDASYGGNASYLGSISETTAITVPKVSTPLVAVTPTNSSTPVTDSLEVNVTITGTIGDPSPTGTVTLSSGSYKSAAATLSAGSDYVSFVIPAGALALGTDILTGNYAPDSASSPYYSSASGSTSEQVYAVATVKVTPSSSSITTAQALSVTVAVSGGSGFPTPTGTVVLTSGNYTSPAATLGTGGATINILAGSLAVGTDTLSVSYSGDSNYQVSVGTASVIVTSSTNTTPSVTVTPSSSTITTAQALSIAVTVIGGSGKPTPTGSVTLTSGSYTSAASTLTGGSATINVPAGVLAVGTDTLTVSYAPDSSSSSTYNSASGTTSVKVTASGLTTPTVSVAPASSSITTTQTLTVTVGVHGGTGQPTPTGTVTLASGTYTSAASSLSGGSATISIPAGSLAIGTDTLTVNYMPDAASSTTYSTAIGSSVVTVTSGTQNSNYAVIYSFLGGTDGSDPWGGLVQDPQGNLYGTTSRGGVSGWGAVFKVDTTGKESVLYSFTEGADGGLPLAALVMDAQGNLYGTTFSGGASGKGTVFKLNSSGKETVLYSFTGGADGGLPLAVLVMDAQGNLYGTATGGGNPACYNARDGDYGCGTVFKVDTAGNESVLYSFTGTAGDGANPFGGLVLDGQGNLCGTTQFGGTSTCTTDGSNGCGTIFKVDSTGKETVLHSFTGTGGDGEFPSYAGLVQDAEGNLYGASGGGTYGFGAVFKVDTSGTETVFYSFKGTSGDGIGPNAVVLDSQGNLYGTTSAGGASGQGTVFRLDTTGKETVLYSFTGTGGDGADPSPSQLLLAQGNLYGTTGSGGSSNFGTAFRLLPMAAAATTTTLSSSQNPSPLGEAVTFTATITSSAGAPPDGESVTFMAGTATLGNGTLSSGAASYATKALPVGTALITALYGGDSNFAAGTSNQVAQVVNKATPTVTVTPSSSSITTAQSLTVSVGVSGGSGNPTPTGTVTLTGGGYNSAASTLSAGSATINIPAGSLATGSDTLTVSYSGDTNYSAANGAGTVTVTTPANPSFTLTGTAATVTSGATTGNTSTITVTPSGGFTGSLALTAAVTSSPAGAQYPPTLSFGSTTPVTITGVNAATATLTISTTAATSGTLVYPKRPGVPWYAAGGSVLACLLFLGMPAHRRRWRSVLGLLMLLVALAGGVLSCGGGGGGGGGGGNPGTTAGAYTITVTGTSGTITQSGTVALTVQ